MTTETLYHAEIGLPANFQAPRHVIRPRYSRHAVEAAQSDRLGTVELPATIALREAKVIEVGVANGRVSKILFRVSYNDTLDLCFVVIPGGSWFCKTIWLQEKSDLHKTLRRERYAVAS